MMMPIVPSSSNYLYTHLDALLQQVVKAEPRSEEQINGFGGAVSTSSSSSSTASLVVSVPPLVPSDNNLGHDLDPIHEALSFDGGDDLFHPGTELDDSLFNLGNLDKPLERGDSATSKEFWEGVASHLGPLTHLQPKGFQSHMEESLAPLEDMELIDPCKLLENDVLWPLRSPHTDLPPLESVTLQELSNSTLWEKSR